MSNIIGTVKNITGHFFARDKLGNVIELKNGDEITQDMLVYGANGNPASSVVEISLLTNGNIVDINGNQRQLFDSSVIAQQDKIEEIGISQEAVNVALDPSIYLNESDNSQNTQENSDGLIANTALGTERIQDSGSVGEFDTRAGDSVNINSTLRDAKFQSLDNTYRPDGDILTHTEMTINDVTRNEDQGTMTFTVRLAGALGTDVTFHFSSAGGTATSVLDFTPVSGEGIIKAGETFTTITVPIIDDFIVENSEQFTINLTNPSPNVTITDPQGVGTILDTGSEPHTDTANIRLVSADANGNPVVDANGNYVLTQNVNEGDNGHYIALAFQPNTTPSPATQISSNGTVTINFGANTDTATGAGTQTTTDGSQDYNNTTQTVQVGQAFSTSTFDDYKADNGETFNVSINNGSYTPPTPTTGYENVVIDTTPVVTTIKDDTGTPNTPNDGPEPTHEAVQIQLVAADASGNPIIVGGNYVFAETVKEGADASYIALAFKPNTIASPSTLISADGTVDVSFTDNSATGAATQTKIDGSQDYNNNTQTVTIGQAFSTATFDDYLHEGNHSFNVALNNGSYIPSTPTSGYENVSIDTRAVVTTITDKLGDEIQNQNVDTVYVQLDTNASQVEAEGALLTHNLHLVDKNNNAVILGNGETITVKLAYANTDTATNADFDPNKVTSVTITGDGINSTFAFSNTITQDTLNEGLEKYNVKIDSITSDSGYFENVEVADTANGAETTVNGAIGEIREEVALLDESETVAEGSVTIDSTTQSMNILANDETGINGKITSFDYKDESGTTQTAILTGGTATVDTQYGHVTINEDGTWSFTSDPTENNPTGVNDVFIYTVTGDNDSAGNPQSGTAKFTITVTDTAPTVASVANVSVDENDLSNGTSPDNAALIVESSLEISKAADSIDTIFNMSEGDSGLTSNGHKVYYYLSNDSKTITASTSTSETGINTTNTIFTDKLSSTTSNAAKHTFTLSGVIDHPIPNAQDTTELTFNYKVTDSDGDVVTNSFKVGIIDDVPTILVEAHPKVLLQESFENFITANSGWHVEHGNGIINAANNTGDTTITGDHGVVWDVGSQGVEIQKNIVVASNDGSSHVELDPHDYDGTLGNTTMTTSVSLSGSDTYELSFAYQPRSNNNGTSDMKVSFGGKDLTIHSDSSGQLFMTSDTSVTYTTTSSANGWTIFNVIYTGITSASADLTFAGEGTSDKIGALLDNIRLEDINAQAEPTLQVDETNLAVNDNNIDFTSSFTSTPDAGADGQQSLVSTYTLGVKSSGVDSGLVDTATGEKVILNLVGGVVEGRTQTSGDLVFTVTTTSAGLLSLDQIRAMMHPNTHNSNEPLSLVDNLITLTKTDVITDKDGDTATDSATLNIGANISFLDDGPTAQSESAISVVEGQVVATGEVNLLANDTFGADGGSTVTSFNFAGSNHLVGTSVTSVTDGELRVNADGTWSYTSPQSVINTNDALVAKSFTYTITDKDGDTSTATQIINVSDGANPTINPQNHTVDETDLGTGASYTPVTVSDSLHLVQGTDNIADTSFGERTIANLNNLGLTSDGHSISYSISNDILTATRDDNKTVFTVKLTNTTNNTAGYEFTLDQPLDHTQPTHDLLWNLPFDVITTDTDGDTVTGSFTVTVLDSVPVASNQMLITDEDHSQTIRLSQDAFSGGNIDIDSNHHGAFNTVVSGGTVAIFDPNATSTKIGTLTNNGDGTLTFKPLSNYSNYNAKPYFEYKVTDVDGDSAVGKVDITVNPVSDSPIFYGNVTATLEDTIHTIGLQAPTVSDNTDINSSKTGDNPERLGIIEIGNIPTGAIISYANGGAAIPVTGGSLKIWLSDATNHIASESTTAPTGAVSMTTAQFEALQITPTPQSDVNINLQMSVTEYEVDDTGNPLSGVPGSTKYQNFTVNVGGVTDPISLSFDNTTDGTLSQHTGGHTNDTYTATNSLSEGHNPIDLQAILTNTSGTTALGDLDGSEFRSYTIEGVPPGTVATFGDVTAVADASGKITLSPSWHNDTHADMNFILTPPDHFSGQINAKITLSVHDTDLDGTTGSSDLSTHTQTVYFNQFVTAVANPVTLQVAQAQGFEDAGRLHGNDSNILTTAQAIDAPATNPGIPLHINVSSADRDGSEYYTVNIMDIPAGAHLYYNGAEVTQTSNAVSIDNFDNSLPLSIVPPFNSDADFNLNINAHSVDSDGANSFTGNNSATLSINVQVTGVADIPVNDGLSSATISDDTSVNHNFTDTLAEDSILDLKSVLADPANLHSFDNDGSETLSMRLTGLADGFDISGAVFLGGSGVSRVWFVNTADLQAGNIKLLTPQNYAGEVDFKLNMITTEQEGDSKTHPAQDISVMVTPAVDNGVHDSMVQNEDQTKTLDFGLNAIDNGALNKGHESITAFSIDMSSVPTGVVLKHADGSILTSGDLNVTNGVVETISATPPANSNGDYNFNITYTITDTAQDASGNQYSTDKTVTVPYNVTVNALTDTDTTISVTNTTVSANITESSGEITANDNGTFTKTLDFHAPSDTDGSELLTHFEIDGIPQGVRIDNAVYAGDVNGAYSGVWYINNVNQHINSADITKTLTFHVDGVPASGNHPITIKAYNQDVNSFEHATSVTFNLFIPANATFTSTSNGTPSDIDSFYQDINADSIDDTSTPTNTTYQGSILREDTQFALGSVVDVHTTNSSDFSITLKNVPANVQIDGMVLNSNGFYTISGSGGESAIIAKLNSILVTPAQNKNTDANDISSTDLNFDIELTTYAQGGQQVMPVTDAMDLTTVNDGTTPEDVAQTFRQYCRWSKHSYRRWQSLYKSHGKLY